VNSPAHRVDGPVWAGIITLWFVWGSTYLAIANVVTEMPVLLSIGLRYLTAAVLLATFVAIRRGPRALLCPKKHWQRAALEGVLLIGAGNGSVCLSEQHVPSGVVAIIVSMMSVWVALLRARFSERPASRTLLGVLVGLAGVGLIVFSGEHTTTGGSALTRTLWSLAVVAGSLGWACGSFFGSRIAPQRDALVGTVWQMTVGGSLMLVVGLITGERVSHADQFSALAWWSLLYLVVIGSLVGQTSFTWLISSGAPLSLVATYSYVNPIVAVLLGVLFRSEPIDPKALMGGAIVLGAVAMVVRGESRKPGS